MACAAAPGNGRAGLEERGPANPIRLRGPTTLTTAYRQLRQAREDSLDLPGQPASPPARWRAGQPSHRAVHAGVGSCQPGHGAIGVSEHGLDRKWTGSTGQKWDKRGRNWK